MLLTVKAVIAKVVALGTVTACSGKDTLVGTTTPAYKVGEAIADTYVKGRR